GGQRRVARVVHAGLLAADVEGAVATHRVEPLAELPLDLVAGLLGEPAEHVLDHVARPLRVAHEPGGVPQEWLLEAVHGLADPGPLGGHLRHTIPRPSTPPPRMTGVDLRRERKSQLVLGLGPRPPSTPPGRSR